MACCSMRCFRVEQGAVACQFLPVFARFWVGESLERLYFQASLVLPCGNGVNSSRFRRLISLKPWVVLPPWLATMKVGGVKVLVLSLFEGLCFRFCILTSRRAVGLFENLRS